jgi:diguanylate cyclase (GGDEF)-like protein
MAMEPGDTDLVNVLVVDDNPASLRAIIACLGDLPGCHFVTAGSGREALYAILNTHFALILLDVQMPWIDGFEVAHLIHERDQSRNIPIVFLTSAFHEDAEVSRGYALGGVDYLIKPVVPEVLRSKVMIFVEMYREKRQIERMVVDLRELSETRLQMLELSKENVSLVSMSTLDPLTGLLNRRGGAEMIARESARSMREGSTICIILLDLDDFKRINDLMGYVVGDQVLCDVARTMRAKLRPQDEIVRLGGDEFLLVLPETRLAEASIIAGRFSSLVNAPVSDEKITASLGVVEVSGKILTLEHCVALAENALHKSKAKGKGCATVLYGLDEMAAVSDILDGFHQILSCPDVLWVAGQNIVSVADESLIGIEMLIRGPAGPWASPDALFHAAADCNALTALDIICFEQCIRIAAQIGAKIDCHVNILPSTLLTISAERLIDIMAAAGCTRSIVFELSEKQFVGDPLSLDAPIRKLRNAGHRLALDDVGFSRSSLETSILLEPSCIKVDRCWVHGVAVDPQMRRLLKRMLGVASGLEATIVAEGVELQEDATALQDLGVMFAQGYLWGKPVKIEQCSF